MLREKLFKEKIVAIEYIIRCQDGLNIGHCSHPCNSCAGRL